MNKFQTKQVTFERGIIENIKQNSFANEQGGFASALYLENYNPNLEFKSLIKRSGIISKGALLKKDQNGTLLWEEHYLSLIYNAFQGKPKDGTFNYDLPFFHLQMMETSLPKYNNTYILFFKTHDIENDYAEMTSILGHVIEYDKTGSQLLLPRWIWPGYDNFVHKDYSELNDGTDYAGVPLRNRGWATYGSYQDSARASGYIIFCTATDDTEFELLPEIVKSRYYPCYKWGLWDITKKRQKGNETFWNGIDNVDLISNNKDDLLRWKVFKPSQEFAKTGISINHRKVYVDQSGTTVNEYKNSLTGSPDTETPIQLLIDEYTTSVALGYPAGESPHFLTTAEENVIKTYSKADDETDPPNFGIKSNITQYPLGMDTINVCDEIDNSYLTYEVPDIPWYKAELATKQTLLNGKLLKYRDWKSNSNYDEITENITVSKHTWGGTTAYANTEVLGVHWLPKYHEAKTPRPFVKGEKIPIVITGTINGSEIILAKQIYEVQNSDYLPIVETTDGHEDPLLNDFLSIDSDLYGFYISDSKDYGYIKRTLLGFSAISSTGWCPKGFRAYPINKNTPYIGIEPTALAGLNHVYQNVIKFGLRIKTDQFETLLDAGLQNIKVYVSEPNENEKIIKYAGLLSPTEIPPNIYCKPKVTDLNDNKIDYSNFRLVSTFVCDGISIIDKYDNYKYYNGESAYQMNGWKEESDGFIYFVTVHDADGVNTPDDDNDRPPYFLYDYPRSSSPLNVNSSGKYWNGKGAKVLGVVKSRVFIGECIDEDGKTEQGKDRYCNISMGVITHDLFPEENWIQIGHLKRTAIVEYREQGWFFNRQSLYRVIMPDIADPTTWEFLDAEHGAGTFSSKTVALTPYGVCFCNENGIWISDGRKPESITNRPGNGLAISSLYQKLAINNTYLFTDYNDIGDVTTGEEGYNEYMELLYNELKDELVLITPVKRLYKYCNVMEQDNTYDYAAYEQQFGVEHTHEMRLIYSFANQNWRVETIRMPRDILSTEEQPNGRLAQYSKNGRLHFSRPEIHSLRYLHSVLNNNYVDFIFEIGHESNTSLIDIYYGQEIEEIYGTILSHEIGDGIDDFLLDRMIVEATAIDAQTQEDEEMIVTSFVIPGWQNRSYSDFADPVMEYQLRSDTHRMQSTSSDWQDIVQMNMLPKILIAANPWQSTMQTPTNKAQTSKETSFTARESLILLAPLNAKFRRARIKYCSNLTSKLNSILIQYSGIKRKSFG